MALEQKDVDKLLNVIEENKTEMKDETYRLLINALGEVVNRRRDVVEHRVVEVIMQLTITGRAHELRFHNDEYSFTLLDETKGEQAHIVHSGAKFIQSSESDCDSGCEDEDNLGFKVVKEVLTNVRATFVNTEERPLPNIGENCSKRKMYELLVSVEGGKRVRFIYFLSSLFSSQTLSPRFVSLRFVNPHPNQPYC